MDKKKKIILITLVIILTIFLVIGGSLAYFGWTTSEDEIAHVDVSVSSGTGSCTLLNDNNTGLFPTSSKYRNRIIKLSAKQEMAQKAYITWDLVINNIEGLQDESFKYELINNTTGEVYTSNGSGNFKDVTSGTTITFSHPTEVLGYNMDYEFTLYLWIDGENFSNNYLTMADQELDIDMNCNITGTEEGTILEQNILMSVSEKQSTTSTFLRSELQRGQIGSITFLDTNEVPSGDNVKSADVSKNEDKSIMLWYYNETNTDGLYDIYIGSKSGKIYLESGYYLFSYLKNVESLDLSNFNTSKVISMNYMFYQTGYNSTSFKIIGLETWDTSAVIQTIYMFSYSHFNTENCNLDLSNWDVSNINNMNSMFYGIGANSKTFDVNLSNWNTINVTDMSFMLQGIGQSATSFKLNLSGWNTSNVNTMQSMIYYVGVKATTFELLGLETWDTSNVTNMNSMFGPTGKNATEFIIDLSNWNVSNVEDTNSMFYQTGNAAKTWSIGDISNWNTVNVKDMSWMFYQVGVTATDWFLDLSNWNVTNVTKKTGFNTGVSESKLKPPVW